MENATEENQKKPSKRKKSGNFAANLFFLQSGLFCAMIIEIAKRSHPMEKITSFTIDHIKLEPGLYVSRKDKVGSETITTFDLRLTSPNDEPVMNTAEIHTMEHLAATFLRNDPLWKERVLYFGPMGCRTGFYLLLAGDLTSRDALPLVRDCFRFIADFQGEVPGASAKDCGNYLDMNLPMANYWGRRYAALLENIPDDRLVYPE
jgi:S-ribosylhomocysteine lyase